MVTGSIILPVIIPILGSIFYFKVSSFSQKYIIPYNIPLDMAERAALMLIGN